jgi:UDP-2-acetamido-3-amino-2,3-dideoxy-glucuronate N-acetyltransferase
MRGEPDMVRSTANTEDNINNGASGESHAGEAPNVRIHPTADVSHLAEIGAGTSIWNNSQVREHARIGRACNLGKDVYIDFSVQIGDQVKIQNGVSVYHGTTIESNVFVGPGVIFTNDKRPRAVTPDGKPKGAADWEVGEILICEGASIGAGAIILPDVRVGCYAIVGAGAVVTRNVPDFALVVGVPARQVGYVCICGATLVATSANGTAPASAMASELPSPESSLETIHEFVCPECGQHYRRGGETLDRHLQAVHR